MKIKKEKINFSDIDADSDPEETDRLVSPSKIKVESPERVANDYSGSGASQRRADRGDDDNEANQTELQEMLHAWSGEQNREKLETIFDKTPFPSAMELKLRQYFEDFSHITPILSPACVDIDLASPDEDTWIIQCPASVDVHRELLNKKLDLSAPRSKIKRCSLEAHVKPNRSDQAIGLMCGTRIKSFRPAGFVRITERLPAEPPVVNLPTDPSIHVEVPFPEHIRARHPLLGFDFEDTMSLSDPVKKRLARARKRAEAFYTTTPGRSAPSVSSKASKLKSITTKKNKKQQPPVETENPKVENSDTVLLPKRSKKRKIEETTFVNPSIAEETPKKVKKEKQALNTTGKTPNTSKKERAVEDDIAWLLNI